jgi:D-sedoheptulose 7-phosphate isomerase
MKDKIISDIEQSLAVKKALIDSDTPFLIEKAVKIIFDCLQKKGKIFFFGNGGSAADSQHLAAEFVGRYLKERKGVAAIALTTDTSILTAVGNDYGYERVFERQIEALGQSGDVAIGITTSGNSKNVLMAISKAKAMGLYTIGMTGQDGGTLSKIADLTFRVPSKKTARIQEAHILIGHIICERLDELL